MLVCFRIVGKLISSTLKLFFSKGNLNINVDFHKVRMSQNLITFLTMISLHVPKAPNFLLSNVSAVLVVL